MSAQPEAREEEKQNGREPVGVAAFVAALRRHSLVSSGARDLLDPQGKQSLEVHEERSEPLAYTFYVVGALALAALAATLRATPYRR